MSAARSFDPIWEVEIYGAGRQMNRYPFDVVVKFVFRHAPRDRPRHEVHILEVGCGAGNNLWFAAREGFSVAGIDASASAVAYARQRLADDGLRADLRVGDFTVLPFEDASFDLAIDRGALVCTGRRAARMAIGEIRRVLRPGGRFLFNPYSTAHSSYRSDQVGPDGLITAVTEGNLIGVGQLCFYDRADVEAVLNSGWRLISREHVLIQDELAVAGSSHAEWRVIVEKVAP